MKLLSRWFRRAPTPPSWIEPVALATRLERRASLLVLDVRGPDEFTGPLGHIREAKNVPLNELIAHLPDLIRDDRPAVVVCKTDRRAADHDYGRVVATAELGRDARLFGAPIAPPPDSRSDG